MKHISEMTIQEMFDVAYTTLRDRGFTRAGAYLNDYADAPFTCQYRSPIGPCAIGALIGDDDYDPEWDENAEPSYDVCGLLGVENYRVLGFADKLQYAHDSGKTPQRMKENLERVAEDYGLSIP